MSRKLNGPREKVAVAKVEKTRVEPKVSRPITMIGLKMLLISALTLTGLLYSESRGYFNTILQGDHTKRKWQAFYDFTEDKNVDILLIGNSHVYTGINPKNLSTALGVNAFILGAPGTSTADHYYTLQEALERTKPQLVVIETYGVRKSNPKEFVKKPLSNQFKSFNARQNIRLKLASTPHLFALKNYPYAWSSTLRNHDYLYTNFEQIEKNIQERKENERRGKDDDLYLGRYVRFISGIEDSILLKYEKQGAPANGLDFKVDKLTKHYVKRIIELCEENDIELMFLTLPMYEKHISDYQHWKNTLKPVLGRYGSKKHWLDLQVGAGYDGFSTISFENTYLPNQHLTYEGSLVATYKLSDFISAKNEIPLPDRHTDPEWKETFYAEEGFFENHTPDENDENNIIVFQGEEAGVSIEILQIKGAKSDVLMAKLFPQHPEQMSQAKDLKVRLFLTLNFNGKEAKDVHIDLQYDLSHSTARKIFYVQEVKKIEVVEITNLRLMYRNEE